MRPARVPFASTFNLGVPKVQNGNSLDTISLTSYPPLRGNIFAKHLFCYGCEKP